MDRTGRLEFEEEPSRDLTWTAEEEQLEPASNEQMLEYLTQLGLDTNQILDLAQAAYEILSGGKAINDLDPREVGEIATRCQISLTKVMSYLQNLVDMLLSAENISGFYTYVFEAQAGRDNARRPRRQRLTFRARSTGPQGPGQLRPHQKRGSRQKK